MTKLLKKEIQHHWSVNAPELDLGLRKMGAINSDFFRWIDEHRFNNESYLPLWIRSLSIPDKRILEIGCGVGTDIREFARNGMKCYAVDLAFSNVSLVKNGFRLMHLKGEVINADAENLPFVEDSFDIVYSFGVLHHTPDTKKAIDEIYRVLKPGGRCGIMLYHKGYAYYLLLVFYGWRVFLNGNNKQEIMNMYDRTPMSKLYSKKEAQGLFSDFRDVSITVTAFGATQVHPILKYVYKIMNKSRFLMRHFGSFIIITAVK